MALEKIIAISGQPGLYKVISQTKYGLVAENLEDGKRIPVYSNLKVSSLAEISIYTEDGDIPLNDVLLKIMEKQDGNTVEAKSDADIKSFFESVLPAYDKGRVYVSDIKKLLRWYNTLLKKDMIKAAEEERTPETKEAEKGEAEEKIIPKKERSKKSNPGTDKKAAAAKSASPKAANKSKGASKVSAPRKAQ